MRSSLELTENLSKRENKSKEEAKKIGATHYLKNKYFKVEFLFLYELIRGSWVMLSFDEYPSVNLKPLF